VPPACRADRRGKASPKGAGQRTEHDAA